MELLQKRIMHGPQFQIHQRIVQVGNAASVQLIAQPVPGLLRGGIQLAPIQKDVALVSMQIEGKPTIGQIVGPAQVFEPGERVAPCKDGG